MRAMRREQEKGGFRPLSAGEVRVLADNGCTAEDWGAVTVAPGFDAAALARSAARRARIEAFARRQNWVIGR